MIQLRLLEVVERVSYMAFPFDQISDYPNCQQYLHPGTGESICSDPWPRTRQRFQSSVEENERGGIILTRWGIKMMMEKITELSYPNQRDLTDYVLRGREPAWVGTELIFLRGWAGSGTMIYPRYMNWLFGTNFLWWNTLLNFDTGMKGLNLASP